MRKQGVDALLIFRIEEIVFDFAILLTHRIIALDFDRAERLAVRDRGIEPKDSRRRTESPATSQEQNTRFMGGATPSTRFHTAIGSDRGRFPVA